MVARSGSCSLARITLSTHCTQCQHRPTLLHCSRHYSKLIYINSNPNTFFSSSSSFFFFSFFTNLRQNRNEELQLLSRCLTTWPALCFIAQWKSIRKLSWTGNDDYFDEMKLNRPTKVRQLKNSTQANHRSVEGSEQHSMTITSRCASKNWFSPSVLTFRYS